MKWPARSFSINECWRIDQNGRPRLLPGYRYEYIGIHLVYCTVNTVNTLYNFKVSLHCTSTAVDGNRIGCRFSTRPVTPLCRTCTPRRAQCALHGFTRGRDARLRSPQRNHAIGRARRGIDIPLSLRRGRDRHASIHDRSPRAPDGQCSRGMPPPRSPKLLWTARSTRGADEGCPSVPT